MKKAVSLTVMACALTAGCSVMENNPVYGEHGLIRDRSQDYEKATEGKALEVPPHLRARQTEQSMEIPGIDVTATERTESFEVPRPEFFYTETTSDKVSLAREAGEKLIVVEGPIDQVWLKLKDFWAYNGIGLEDTDPHSGVMETTWIQNKGPELGFVDSWIKRLTFQEIEGPTKDKLRVALRPDMTDTARTSISMKHVRVAQAENPDPVDWDGRAREVGFKTEMMFEMLRYLSKASDKDSAPTLTKFQAPPKGVTALGRDARGNPVLKIDGSVDEVWQSVVDAMSGDRFDVGTRDRDAGMVYFSYTSTVKVEEKEKMGFFEWLHSDRGEIKFETTDLAEALGMADDEQSSIRYSSEEAETVVESAMTPEEREQQALQNAKGFKLWFAGKVIYVFGSGEEESAGTYNEAEGTYEFTGRYQLKLNRSRSGAYFSVLTDQGLAAPKDVSEEILWDLKDGLTR